MLLTVFTIAFCSCENEEGEATFSNRGTEADKTALENSSKLFKQELTQLGETDFCQISYLMSQRLEGKQLSGNTSFLKAVIDIGVQMHTVKSIEANFNKLLNIASNESSYCEALLQDGYGIWEWNNNTQQFIKADSHESEIIFKFPATENINGNEAVLTISDFEMNDNQGSNKVERLFFNIKVNDELILSSNTEAEFTNGYYDYLAITFNPQPYTLSSDLFKDQNQSVCSLIMNHEDTEVFSHTFSLTFGSGEDKAMKSIFSQLQMADINIETIDNTGELQKTYSQLNGYNENSEVYATTLANTLNNSATTLIKYNDNGAIIATTRAFAHEYEEEKWWVNLELIFSDGSAESSEDYFEDYIGKVKLELNSLVGLFQENFDI